MNPSPARRSRFHLAGGLLVLSAMSLAAMFAEGQAPASSATDRPARSPAPPTSAGPSERQVTAFAILAIPESSELDPRLVAVQKQLRKVLPGHGFRLIEVQSKRIEKGKSIVCDLGAGYRAETVLVSPLDEDGKVQFRCNLSRKGSKEFSTLVRSPLNQLFFYERLLEQGTRVLIGVGAR
ncbi:MAG: hypothetical protein U0790_07675 [Isosphaeraceae bacterium]